MAHHQTKAARGGVRVRKHPALPAAAAEEPVANRSSFAGYEPSRPWIRQAQIGQFCVDCGQFCHANETAQIGGSARSYLAGLASYLQSVLATDGRLSLNLCILPNHDNARFCRRQIGHLMPIGSG